MNTSALLPASIWRASTELAANDSFTVTPEDFSQAGANSPSTFVSEAAAKTSSSGFFGSSARAAPASASAAMHAAKNFIGRSKTFMMTRTPDFVAFQVPERSVSMNRAGDHGVAV